MKHKIANKVYNIMLGHYKDTPVKGASKDSKEVADWHISEQRKLLEEIKGMTHRDTVNNIDNKLKELSQ